MILARFHWSKQTRRNTALGLLFITPWIIGFLLFNLYPTLASFYYSFTDKALVRPAAWVGLENYAGLLGKDPLFLKSLSNTLYMVAIGVPLSITVAFGTALLLNMQVRGIAIYRTIYYLPTIMPPVAGTLLWLWILNPQYGVLNAMLGYIGLRSPAWFADPNWSKPALILMSLWGVGQSTILYLAALQDVPPELHEAAKLDGAGWLQRTWRVTIPMVSPATLFLVITGIIGTFQLFTQSYIVGGIERGTSGSPRQSLLFYALYLYRQGFEYLHMGYAAAMAWILFLIILGVTLVMIRTSAYWTHYET